MKKRIILTMGILFSLGTMGGDLSGVLEADGTEHYHAHPHRQNIRIMPAYGTTQFLGLWNKHILNYSTFGLMVDIPISEDFSIELEGAYAKSFMTYLRGGHDFDLYTVGALIKVEPFRGNFLSPYVATGMVANGFYNMSYGPRYPYSRYHAWVGSLDVVGGLNINFTHWLAVGARAEVLFPLIGRPYLGPTGSMGFSPSAGYEEAAAISTGFARWMLTASISL